MSLIQYGAIAQAGKPPLIICYLVVAGGSGGCSAVHRHTAGSGGGAESPYLYVRENGKGIHGQGHNGGMPGGEGDAEKLGHSGLGCDGDGLPCDITGTSVYYAGDNGGGGGASRYTVHYRGGSGVRYPAAYELTAAGLTFTIIVIDEERYTKVWNVSVV
jgi:hypothetical protein